LADLEVVCNEIKRRIAPNAKLKAEVLAKAEEIRAAVQRECRKARLHAEVRVDGSVAKDTWIRDSADVDIFMKVSPKLTKEQLRDVCLPIAKRALRPAKTQERYAEHPYAETLVKFGKGRLLRVNVVPCYRVERGHWLSATDRTPYHTEYIRQHLTEPQHDEVRLLKAFMKGIGSYGADIKTGGFSGMLCETLIAARGDFRGVVNEFSKWREAQFIDLENYYGGRIDEVYRLFREPLIVIDPVDRGRNLAAAVRKEQLWNLVAACRQLIATPATAFFEQDRIKSLTAAAYRRMMKERGSVVLVVVMGRIDVVVDVLWSQLYRTERALANLLSRNGFSIIRSASWSDEQSLNVILLELEQDTLPGSRRHVGPPVSRVAESSSFLAKHMVGTGTVSGPWVEGNRWVVQKERDCVSAVELLRAALRSGGRTVGVASEPARSFRKKVEILNRKSIEKLLRRNREFAKAMNSFLVGRPTWFG
jgi:tRNA nucleotidyltransferase (CCA-adding enzyme)